MAKKKTVRADGRMEKVFEGKHFYGRTEAEIQNKILAYRTKTEVGPMFNDVADDYEEYISSDRHPLRIGTLRTYIPHLNKLRTYFYGKPIKDIEPSDVRSFLEYLKNRNYSAKTISNCKGVMSCVFSFWCAELHGNKNPVQLAGLPSGMKPNNIRMPPTEDQINAVSSNVSEDGFWAQLFRYTGVRLGEANALTWNDIDFENKMITVNKAYLWDGNRPYLSDTKTINGVRSVPILDPLLPLLEQRKIGHPKTDFIMSNSDSPLTQSQYKHRWLYFCKSIGIAHYYENEEKIPATHSRPERTVKRKVWVSDVTAHQFRHLYATALFEAGLPDLVAQRLLGHADIMTTRKIYQHFREKTLPAYTEKLNEYFRSET